MAVYRVLSVPGAADHRVIKAKKNVEPSWRHRIMVAAAELIVIVAALSVWYFYLRGPSIEPASVDRVAYPLPDKPSIAILSFRNMSGDPNQEYIGDGISENITSALSMIGGMFVIARESVLIYKEKPAKTQQVA